VKLSHPINEVSELQNVDHEKKEQKQEDSSHKFSDKTTTESRALLMPQRINTKKNHILKI
jgi:hypothetical protein